MRWSLFFTRTLNVFLVAALCLLASGCRHSRPYNISGPEFYVYQGRLLGARYPLAVHTWFAYRQTRSELFTVVHYMYRVPGEDYAGIHSFETDQPSEYWGSDPGTVICSRYQQPAAKAISDLKAQLSQYPQDGSYWLFPGPNSNTFIAYTIDQLALSSCELPATAIGKDFPVNYMPVAATPSGTGFRLSLLGIAGLTLGIEEGIQINLLGLSFGIDFKPFALQLPFIGRLGYSQFTEPPDEIRTD